MLNSYALSISFRVLLLLAALLGVAYALLERQWLYVGVGAGVVAGQIYELVRYLNRSNRELADFLEALRYRDFSIHFNTRSAPASVRDARRVFNEINKTFKRLSREKEAQYQYLQNVLGLIDTGILSFDEQGQVHWMNEALKRMLDVPYLKNLSSIEKRDSALYEVLIALKPGENRLVRIHQQQVLLAATAFADEAGRSVLVAFQNVNQALDETETEAYQKILRVLTHELMNSVAPIASLADTLQKNALPAEAPADLRLGLETIRQRSEGLLRFAQTYRNLSKITLAGFQQIAVLELFDRICLLLEPNFARLGGVTAPTGGTPGSTLPGGALPGLEPDVILKDPTLQLRADLALIEQVLINLIINALEALADHPAPVLRLAGFATEPGGVTLEVADNGAGIPPDLLDAVFVPFFTTKKSGSGIGLSLSRQIMHLHGGSIAVQSVVGQGSVFRLEFPAGNS